MGHEIHRVGWVMVGGDGVGHEIHSGGGAGHEIHRVGWAMWVGKVRKALKH